jgi:hypothetical protein
MGVGIHDHRHGDQVFTRLPYGCDDDFRTHHLGDLPDHDASIQRRLRHDGISRTRVRTRHRMGTLLAEVLHNEPVAPVALAEVPCVHPLGPKFMFRATFTRAMDGFAFPSLNSVHANSQRRHPTHFVGSPIISPSACSMMIKGAEPPRTHRGFSADIPTIAAPLSFKN